MLEYHDRLAKLLLEKNKELTYEQALTWVELLSEDFEATYAKAGHDYMGSAVTEKVVRQWIEHYGAQLHDFVERNPKYKHLLGLGDEGPKLH